MIDKKYFEYQVLSEEEEKLRDEAYARLRIWKDGCQEIHDRAKTARKILLLQDPYQDPEGTPIERKTLQVQTLKSTFNNCVADQVDNVMEAKLMPETVQTQEVTDDMNDIVRFIYEYNEYQAMHRIRVEDFICTGTAVTQIMWDADAEHGQGEVTFFRVPIESFLWDPAESDIQNARALIKVTWHPLSWYEQHYPDKFTYISADEHTADAVGENQNQEELGADEAKAMLMEYWYRKYDSKKNKYTINVAYFAGRALLEHSTDVYAHGMYPFVLDVHTPIEGLPVGEGMVMELAPMMRYINRYIHYMDVNIRASAKTRLLMRKDSGIKEEQIADWNNDIITGDRIDEQAIRYMESKPLSNLALNQMLQMMTDLKQDSGQNQFTRGETAGGVTAATAISALQEAGGKQTRMRTEVLKRGFKRITEQVLWLVSQFYKEDRIMRITGKEAPREIDASPSRLMGKKKGVIPAPPYTVRVQVERMNPNAISEQNQLFVDAYKMSAESGQMFPLSALFSILNIDGKDRILPIIRDVEHYQQVMQQMQEQNQMLQQQNAEQQESINNLRSSMVEMARNAASTSARNSAELSKSNLSGGALQPQEENTTKE